MQTVDYYLSEAIRLFYLSRRTSGNYARDCSRMSFYELLCWAILTEERRHG